MIASFATNSTVDLGPLGSDGKAAILHFATVFGLALISTLTATYAHTFCPAICITAIVIFWPRSANSKNNLIDIYIDAFHIVIDVWYMSRL